MRFIYLTDLHLRAARPVSRLDEEYFEVQFQKLDQILNYVKKNKIKYVFIGGDIFDSTNTSAKLLIRSLQFFKELSEHCTAYCILGNHDIIGTNPATINRVPLGALFVLDNIIHLDNINIDGTVFIGLDFMHNSNVEKYMIDKDAEMLVIITHDMIVPHENFPYNVIGAKTLKTTADLVLCGHYHLPFEVKTETTTFLNPGSLMRLKLTEDSLGRIPQFIDITISDNKIDYTFIPLEVPNSLDIFDIDTKGKLFDAETKRSEFFASLSSLSKDIGSFDIEESLKTLLSEEKINKDIFDQAVRRIQDARALSE